MPSQRIAVQGPRSPIRERIDAFADESGFCPPCGFGHAAAFGGPAENRAFAIRDAAIAEMDPALAWDPAAIDGFAGGYLARR